MMKTGVATLAFILICLALVNAPAPALKERDHRGDVTPALEPAFQPLPASNRVRKSVRGRPDDGDELKSLLAGLEETASEPAARATAAKRAAALLSSRDPVEISRAITGIPGLREQRILIAEIVKNRLVTGNPVDLQWIHNTEDRNSIRFAHETLARHWSSTDPDAVWDFLEKLESETLQRSVVAGLAWTMAHTDFEQTATWISGLEESPLRDIAALKTAKILATEDPQAAVEWAAAFPPGELQEEALTYGLHQWTQNNPTRTVEWANSLTNETVQSYSIPQIAAAWANRDPKSATLWAHKFPLDLRDEAISETLIRWRRQDREAADLWAQTQ